MPFHLFGHLLGPPHLHLFPVVLSSALVFAAGAYIVSRNGVPAGAARLGERLKERVAAWRRPDSAGTNASASVFARTLSNRGGTGNSAFEEYRAAALGGLEAEAADFRAHLDSLRHAKDKTEFEAFLNERRDRSSDSSGLEPQPPKS